MRFEEITQQDALEIIARSAMKHEYDKGGMIGNAGAYRDSVIRRALENEAAVPGTLRLAYQAAAKNLASDEPPATNMAAYQPWREDDDHAIATALTAARWMRLISAIQTLPREHELRRAVRDATNGDRPWDLECRRPTPEEEAEYEERALATLDHLKQVAEAHGLKVDHQMPGPVLFTLPTLDDDDIPGYGDAA